MDLSTLKPAEGAKKRKKRIGRGVGSGHGVTACRGSKGQRARSGGKKGPSFEGGQTPLQRRLPQYPGFKNRGKKVFTAVNVSKLDLFKEGSIVDREALVKAGITKPSEKLIKLLGVGELKKKLTVKVNAFSKEAVKKIEAAGGKAEII